MHFFFEEEEGWKMFLAFGLGGISVEALIIFLIPTIWGRKQGYTVHFALVLSQFFTYISVKHICVLKEGKGKDKIEILYRLLIVSMYLLMKDCLDDSFATLFCKEKRILCKCNALLPCILNMPDTFSHKIHTMTANRAIVLLFEAALCFLHQHFTD